jgi:hypothetical protein
MIDQNFLTSDDPPLKLAVLVALPLVVLVVMLL